LSTRFGNEGSDGGFFQQRVRCLVPGARCTVGTARCAVVGQLTTLHVSTRRSFFAVRSSQLPLLAMLHSASPLLSQGLNDSLPAAKNSSPYRSGIDVLDYELRVSLPDAGNIIDGVATLTVRRTAPVDTLVLDFLRLNVRSVQINDVLLPLGANGSLDAAAIRDSATIRIVLPAGTPDTFRVAIQYDGAVTDGLIVRTDSLGRWTGFGDNWPNRGRHWIPGVDHPSDKATVTWIVEAPSERRVVANGLLVEETPLIASRAGMKPRTRTIWREAHPIPLYLMVIAAAPLAYYDLGCGPGAVSNCTRQSVYVAPEVRGFLPGPFSEATAMMEYFVKLIAPFPYDKLAHLQSSTRFGGMENASAIFYSDAGFRRGTMGTGVIAHETAHQWFGDAVTPLDWGHVWLSEGFATYFKELWVRHSAGDSAFRREMRKLREEILTSEVVLSRPVIDTAETQYINLLNTNSYQKGGWVLHMLRGQVGDSAFFRGVRSYYRRYKHGNAVTDDLMEVMQRTSGQRLGWFFDQWLRRPGFAEVASRWSYDERTRRVSLGIAQGQQFPPFRFPLVIEIREASGAVRRVTVPVGASRVQRFTLPVRLDRAPEKVILDPDVQILGSFTTR